MSFLAALKVGKLIKGIIKGAKAVNNARKAVGDQPISKVVGGAFQPMPLSGFIPQIRKGIKEAREQKNYTRLIRLIPYLLVGGFTWWVLYKGLMTIEQINEWMEVVENFVKILG